MDKEQLARKYAETVDQYLGLLTEELVTELKPLSAGKQPPDTALLLFEVEMQDVTRGFPIGWRALGKEDSPVSNAAGGHLLNDLDYTVPDEVTDAGVYEAAEVDTWDISFVRLVAWFSDCWQKAGGAQCAYPAYVRQRDDPISFDLRECKWVSAADAGPGKGA